MKLPPAIESLQKYWTIYGGFSALFSSFYFYITILIALLSLPYSLHSDWHKAALTFLPSLFGFSLAAYALILSIGGSDIVGTLATPDEDQEYSDYQVFSATFFHFLFIQFIAVSFCILRVISESYSLPLALKTFIDLPFLDCANDFGFFLVSFVGWIFAVYSFWLCLAMIVAIFRISGLIAIASNQND